MTTNDMTTQPHGEPEPLEQMFGEVFDLVDETVDRVTDDEVGDRLRQVLAAAGYEDPGDSHQSRGALVDPGRTIAHLDVARLAKELSTTAEWEQTKCLLRALQEEVAIAQTSAVAARRESEIQMAIADRATQAVAEAQKHATEVKAGADAYVDKALDRAQAILAEAREQAARIVADAERQTEEITAAARTRVASIDATPPVRSVFLSEGHSDRQYWQALTRLVAPDLASSVAEPPRWIGPGTFVTGLIENVAPCVDIVPASVLQPGARLDEVLRSVADAFGGATRIPTGSFRRAVRIEYPLGAGLRVDALPAIVGAGSVGALWTYVDALVGDVVRAATAECLVGAGQAKRWILVGDEQQLPPFAEGRCLTYIDSDRSRHPRRPAGRCQGRHGPAFPDVLPVEAAADCPVWTSARTGSWRKVVVSVKRLANMNRPDAVLAVVPSATIEILVMALVGSLPDRACGAGGFLANSESASLLLDSSMLLDGPAPGPSTESVLALGSCGPAGTAPFAATGAESTAWR